jgi:hypothetical protein
MRALLMVAELAGACSEKPAARPPKAPNNELIVGEFERRPPDGHTALRFLADGTFVLAKDRSQLDVKPAPATGTYTLDGDKLTFTNEQGLCADSEDAKVGTYQVVLSKIGIRYTKVGDDACERRATIDGQTWWRIK